MRSYLENIFKDEMLHKTASLKNPLIGLELMLEHVLRVK
jgi:hypothetical protein